MRDDEPSDAVHDLFSETLFGDTPLGRSVLGTVESIEALTRDDVDGWYREPLRHALDRGHRRRAGRPPAGARPGDRGLRRPARPATPARRRCGSGTARPDAPGPPDRPHLPAHRADAPAARARRRMGRLDERRYAGAVLDAAVGGGMSSRLFQEIREKRGLVYSVGSALTHYAGAGVVLGLRRLLEEAGARGAAADPRGARPGGRRRAHRRGGRARPWPAQGRPGAGPRGHRLADEPAGQERAVLRGVPAGARGAGRLDAVDEDAGARGGRRAVRPGDLPGRRRPVPRVRPRPAAERDRSVRRRTARSRAGPSPSPSWCRSRCSSRPPSDVPSGPPGVDKMVHVVAVRRPGADRALGRRRAAACSPCCWCSTPPAASCCRASDLRPGRRGRRLAGRRPSGCSLGLLLWRLVVARRAPPAEPRSAAALRPGRWPGSLTG